VGPQPGKTNSLNYNQGPGDGLTLSLGYRHGNMGSCVGPFLLARGMGVYARCAIEFASEVPPEPSFRFQ